MYIYTPYEKEPIAEDSDLDEQSGSTVHLCTSESEREEIVGVKRGHIKRVVSSDNDADMVPVCTSEGSTCSSIPAKKPKIDKTEDDVIPLPDPFILPKHFPHNIEVSLRRKALSTKEKQRFTCTGCLKARPHCNLNPGSIWVRPGLRVSALNSFSMNPGRSEPTSRCGLKWVQPGLTKAWLPNT